MNFVPFPKVASRFLSTVSVPIIHACALATLSVVFCASPSKAAEEKPESGVVSLEGDWKFSRDKEDKGLAGGFASLEFDDSAWEQLRVPGAYNHQGHGGYLGVSWYRLTVKVPAAWKGKPVFLQLPPVDDSDETFWNGKKIGGLGAKKFMEPRFYPVPADNINWGGDNVIAVRVTNKYMGGGFTTQAPANLLSVGAFTEPVKTDPESAIGEALMPLAATKDLSAKLTKTWVPGWRDQGTADTRPKLHVRTGPEKGTEALGFDITHPNASGEFVDYMLLPNEQGPIWASRDYDFIQFDYQTHDTEGEMQLFLNNGNWRWMKGKPGFGTSFRVKKGDWTRVILPLEEFHFSEPRKTTFLDDLKVARALSLGYRNNEMQSKGEVKFANFAVGRFAGKSLEKVKLDGLWHFAEDPEDKGLANNWHGPGGDFKTWDTLATAQKWFVQGRKEYTGPAWLKQEVFIPENWRGMQLRLRLGRIQSAKDPAEVFVNGVSVGKTGSHDTKLDFTVPASAFQAGKMNSIAIRFSVSNPQVAGLVGGPFEIAPQSVWMAVRREGSREEPMISTEFDPGPIVGKANYEIFIRLPKHHLPEGATAVDYEITDWFHRVIKSGEGKVQEHKGENYVEVLVVLNDQESRRLYFSEIFDVKILAKDAQGNPLYAGTQLDASLSYRERDQHVQKELPETWEETPYGKLKLIDVIDAGEDPAAADSVYKQGGHGKSWVGRRAYSSWVEGVEVKEFQGKKYREVNNNEWFGYRVGRGKIQPGKAYLVRIEYPEDKTRYAPINIDAGKNYQGLGFRTGVAEDDPWADYPLTGKYEFFDTVVIPDETTYGSKGSRTVPSDNGFWIFFFDTGRAYVPEYQSGAAASRILVYEMPEGDAANPTIRFPKDAPHRYLVADWEREPEWVPKDMVRHAKMFGYNAISPSILKWGRLAFWHTENEGKITLASTHPVREELKPGMVSALDAYLAASKEVGIAIFPRLEYGGSDSLPESAKAIGRNGKLASPNRFHKWCSNILQPEVFAEFSEILQQVIGKNIKDNPQIQGILYRNRSDRQPISYGPSDVAAYAKDTGDNPPAGLEGEKLSKWASDPERHQKYIEWWQGKRRDFHAEIVKDLRKYRPDLKMLYYNWDPDRWDMGEYKRTPEDYRDYYNVHTSGEFYKRKAAAQKGISNEDYVRMVREGGEPLHQLRPELYADMEGFALLGPVNWHYLADNPEYLNFFRTGDQLALTKIFDYEEKGRWNVQGDNYETSELMTGGPDFAMAEQVLSVFHGDPWIITETTYTYGQGYLRQHQEFAQAFLSLPALPGKLIETPGLENGENLKIRRYDVMNQVHLSLAYKGYSPGTFSLELAGTWPKSVRVTDQVTGDLVPAEIRDGKLALDLSVPPMTLMSLLIEPNA
jgi:hypothetical protein